MNYQDIIANPKLLHQMTVQEHEFLTYEQQIERLKQLMKPAAPIVPSPAPF